MPECVPLAESMHATVLFAPVSHGLLAHSSMSSAQLPPSQPGVQAHSYAATGSGLPRVKLHPAGQAAVPAVEPRRSQVGV